MKRRIAPSNDGEALFKSCWRVAFISTDSLLQVAATYHTAVVARAGKSRGYVLSTEAGVVGVISEGGPDDLSIFE